MITEKMAALVFDQDALRSLVKVEVKLCFSAPSAGITEIEQT